MFCTECGAQVDDNAVACAKCGVAIPKRGVPVASATGSDATMRLLVPIGRSGWAIASGYLGLLSVFPFVGVLAIVTGILALADIQKHTDKHGTGRAVFGIVLGTLSVIVYAGALLISALT